MFVPLGSLDLPGILSVVSDGLKLVMLLSWHPECWDYTLSRWRWLGHFSTHLFCKHSWPGLNPVGPGNTEMEETQPYSEEFTTQNIIG